MHKDSDDGLISIKFINEIRSEIIDSTKFDCISQKFDPTIKPTSNTISEFAIESPLQQMKKGTAPENVMCKQGFSLLLKSNGSNGSCVKESSVDKLVQRGWIAQPSNFENNIDAEQYAGIIPTSDSRAKSYVVRIVDSPDFDAPKSWDTFSKFAPYSKPTLVYTELSPIPLGMLPDYTIGDKPQFYLESMPSKDKIDYYEIVSSYINLGKDPEPFDIQVDILSGSEQVLQRWSYDDCQMVQFSTFLNEQLLTYKFHEKFTAEFQDRTLFECVGLGFNDELESET